MRKTAKAAVGIVAVTLTTTISYQVRQLAAAMLIFGIVLGTAGVAVLLLILTEEAILEGAGRIEARIAARSRRRRMLPAPTHTSTALRLGPR